MSVSEKESPVKNIIASGEGPDMKITSDNAAIAINKKPRQQRPFYAVASEKILEIIIRISGVSAIIFVLAIFFFVFREAIPVVFNEKFNFFQFLFSTEWYPTSAVNIRYGTFALTVGSLSITLLSVAIALPFGIGAAIYISEFCGPRLRESLKIIIELLAAIPSVVWGFIGLTVMSKVIVTVTGAPIGVNLLNGSIMLALMSVPIIVSIGEDALKAVPDSFREAALAQGATKWQVVYRVLLPAAKNGLLAAVLLGVGRAVGETMAVLMATGHAVAIPGSLVDPIRTLTANIAAELGEAPARSDHYRVLFLTGILLFCITFAINLIADLVIRGIHGKNR
jgi:phosphate transport system permease protein